MKRLLLFLLHVLLSLSLIAQGPIVQFCNTAESLAPKPPGATDPDAQTFFTAAGITDNTQKDAVNRLVLDLKAAGIWSKMKAIYPFVGGAASTHAVNLRTPGTFDLQFYNVFSGDHGAGGTYFDGNNQYANSFLNERDILTLDDVSMGYYCTDTDPSRSGNIDHHGAYNGDGDAGYLASAANEGKVFANFYGYTPSHRTEVTGQANVNGFHAGVKGADKKTVAYYNQLYSINSSTSSGTLPNLMIYWGALNNSGSAGFNWRGKLSFAFVGASLTQTEMSGFYSVIQTYQTALGRAVN